MPYTPSLTGIVERQLLMGNKSFQYYDTIVEIRECCSAFIFAILGYYFLKKEAATKQISLAAESNSNRWG